MEVVLGIAAVVFLLYICSDIAVRRAEKKYPPSGSFVEVDGIRLHYQDEGEGRPVVLLHGGVLWGGDFKEVMTLAAKQGYRALAFDRPGYGYSERLPSRNMSPRDQARLLHGALRKLGIERPIVVAHSWSGVLALTYALDYPEDVSGLVTVGGGMYRDNYPAADGDGLSRLVTMPILGSLLLHTLLVPFAYLASRSMMLATFTPERVPEAYGRAVRALWFRPGQFRANREDVLQFAPACDEISSRYGEVAAPVVIAAGEADPFPTLVHSTWLHRDLPHSRLILYPGVGHMIPQLHPELVMESIQALTEMESQEMASGDESGFGS
ncbi:alpha/beta fold hydrolase [Paenibacillus campinasensis]|uniref:Alpha/beta fold hydrolase n=1 Tax=Paenibacillus campinasensis TaxID=66347 RepID=A0ABW9SZS5_9BACL|nr:alpha/beta hydrolase [Paenibacillus campinasensis]MUG66528.1 alpha/beta fold hydrolase [Paenibacillus campinasensis]